MTTAREAVTEYFRDWGNLPEAVYVHPKDAPATMDCIEVDGVKVPVVFDPWCPPRRPFALGERAARQHVQQWLGSELYYMLYNTRTRPYYWDGTSWCARETTWNSVCFGFLDADYIFRAGDH